MIWIALMATLGGLLVDLGLWYLGGGAGTQEIRLEKDGRHWADLSHIAGAPALGSYPWPYNRSVILAQHRSPHQLSQPYPVLRQHVHDPPSANAWWHPRSRRPPEFPIRGRQLPHGRAGRRRR